LIRQAFRRRLPILGICRGSQLLNVVCGGTLYGDVQKEKNSRIKHIDYRHYDTYRHRIRVVPGTPLAEWYAEPALNVNSYHHQGTRRLASRFKPMAFAEDGLIEAFYDPKARFVVGLQFHPERMLPEYPGNRRVWNAFASAVRDKRTSRISG
jgi:gamma-glutamyl-gamma-aminobutyrate hydrolase PuuD